MKRFSGTIYKNGSRYWYKFRVAGEAKPRQIPLKQPGMKFATKDPKAAELIAEEIWQQAIAESPQSYNGTISGLVATYQEYVKNYYLPPSTESQRVKYATDPLAESFSDVPVNDFTPLHLKQFRNSIIESKKYSWGRKTINDRVNVIKRMFKWAASEMLVSIHTYTALATVEGLRKGRTGAREGKKILPVPDEHIDALLPFLSETAAKIMMVQRYTGMRSGEVCQMMPRQIEKGENVWLYRPKHKTEHLGHIKVVPLGPKSQEIIKPLLVGRKPSEPLFKTMFGNAFDKDNYRHELIRAFDKAEEAGVKIPYFHPHRIRHTVGTAVRDKFGPEYARAVLGHRELSATEIYAELDLEKAEKVATMIG